MFRLNSVTKFNTLLCVFLGALQYVQAVCVSTVPVAFFGVYTGTPGVVVLFAGDSFANLLVYVTSDIGEARILITAILLSNVCIAALVGTVRFSDLGSAASVQSLIVPRVDIWHFIFRTLLLAIESVAVIVTYETLGRLRLPLPLRVLLSLAVVLAIDAMLWQLLTTQETRAVQTVLIDTVVGRTYASVIYGAVLSIVVMRFRRIVPEASHGDDSRDILGILQY